MPITMEALCSTTSKKFNWRNKCEKQNPQVTQKLKIYAIPDRNLINKSI